jgi:acetolactate synthase-1/2/3 large subunit
MPTTTRSGGHVLVDALRIHRAELSFCVPGESFLDVLDAFYAYEGMRLVTCRHEGGAAVMAEAYGKLTGRPGVCFVTRGPGATNASIGVHTAFQDSTPMILFVGQVGRDFSEREAFQEIDFRRMFGQMAKWVAQIDDARRIPEMVGHAFHLAVSGRPGPIVLALPEDMLAERVAVADTAPYKLVQAHPGAEDLARLRELIAGAERPLMILGGSGWTQAATLDIRAFAERMNLPVACAFRRQDLFDNRHRLYAGDAGIGINPALAQRIRAADLILAVGPRLGEATTGGYTLIEAPTPRQRLVHVFPGADELGRVFAAELPIVAGMPQFAAAARALEPVAAPARARWAEEAREDYLATATASAPPNGNASTTEVTGAEPRLDAVDLAEIVKQLRELLPDDAVLTNGAGNFAGWLHRFFTYRDFGTQLAPTNGAMGYGVPAAIAAKILHPERSVVAFCGDGDFLMTGQELATAVQQGANVIFVVVNNGMYGTIRMHQERRYPGRVVATDLTNPDFAAYARAFGAYGEAVERTADFGPAFARALAAGTPALIELRLDPEAITPRTTLRALRAASESARAELDDDQRSRDVEDRRG